MARGPTEKSYPKPHSRAQGQSAYSLGEYYSGRKLFGNDFSLEEVREWYGLEENACFEIYDQGKKRMPNNDFLHWSAGYRWALEGRSSLGKVLGLGSGNGEEFRPVRKWIEHLFIAESADGYSQNDPSKSYVKAQTDGTLLFPDNFFDTAVTIAVLHHIPNVSHVLRELFRSLKPGGNLPTQGAHHNSRSLASSAQSAPRPMRARFSP